MNDDDGGGLLYIAIQNLLVHTSFNSSSPLRRCFSGTIISEIKILISLEVQMRHRGMQSGQGQSPHLIDNIFM